jgi:hypothetical protein
MIFYLTLYSILIVITALVQTQRYSLAVVINHLKAQELGILDDDSSTKSPRGKNEWNGRMFLAISSSPLYSLKEVRKIIETKLVILNLS